MMQGSLAQVERVVDAHAVEMGHVAPSIALSWQRCRERGVSRAALHLMGQETGQETGQEALELARQLALARPVLEDVYQFVEGSPCALGFADSGARLLTLIGEAGLLRELAEIGWVVGSRWGEEAAGTNGLALAIHEAFPAQVRGGEHYCAMLERYCTVAAPVYDSLGGLIGAVVAVTPAEEEHPYTLGMMSAAANALTTELRMNLWLGSANELLLELNAILQTLSEGIVLLQGDGAIMQMTARAGRLLGLAPARVTGRRLAEVVETPPALSDALRLGRELYDEEMRFRVGGEFVSCVCTLKAITAPNALAASSVASGLPETAGARPGGVSGKGGGGLSVAPRVSVGGFVLTLRSVERVQRLAHRMAGAQARMQFGNIIGQSPAALEAVRMAQIAAESASTVLLHGETGTGKEVFAQSIHNGSARAAGPFVAINCAAIPRELISSELFGYEGGAFTGADRHGRPGKFEVANGGTLFLDEIGDMPRDLQSSLLRAIETRSVVRIGGQHVTAVDVRIIAATHKDLAEEVRLGAFRSDLFFRLNVFPIEIPALRARGDDVPLLTQYTLQRLSSRLNRALAIEEAALVALTRYAWPGNVRELENVVERAVYIAERGVITLADLPEHIRRWGDGGRSLGGEETLAREGGGALEGRLAGGQETRGMQEMQGHGALRTTSEGMEAALIRRTLASCGGNVALAAESLGISRTTLWRKKRRYGL